MKIATDLEQSKRLAKILSLDTADMYYLIIAEDEYSKYPIIGDKENIAAELPAWSLTALLKALKDYNLLNIMDGRCLVSSNSITSHLWIDPVDACVEMIEELKERNLL